MGKSSSSSRKKRSRNRSKSRTMKKTKRSKSERIKSKKHRRRHDSVSYSDDSDSRSLASVSLSGSENEYVSRKSRSRSRTRKDVKGSKKRGRKRSLSSDSSLSSPVRKSKRSKSSRRDDKRGTKRRDRSRKKSRRDVSVSSASGESKSGSESDEGEFVKRRGKSERKEKRGGKSEKVEIRSRKSRDRSRSSSRSRYSEFSEYESEEEIAVEQNTSRRLKSVAIVVKRESEERELEDGEHKEEIISDHNDYPSSKSNDSNDGVIVREVSQHLDHDQGENTDVSNFRTSSVSGKNGISSSDLVGKNDDEEKGKSEASGSAGSLGVEDLETILRQRALENLKKFRGGSQTNVKTPAIQKGMNDSTVNISSKEENKSVQLVSLRKDAANVILASEGSKQHRLPATRNDSGWGRDGKDPEGSDGGDKGDDVASLGNNNASAPIPKEKVNVGISSKSSNPREISQESLNTRANVKQGTLSKETVLMTRNKGKESAAEPAQSIEPQSDNKIKSLHDSTQDQPSSPGSIAADVGSGNSQDATKDGSEFEQRTMTVMRGGELVQVSYKVKIPKRTPALARRQLKR